MTPAQLRLITILLTSVAAGLAFVLGGAQQIGMDSTVALILGAALAAINVAIGYLPSYAGTSSLVPGKTEERVVREALSGQPPRGLV
jgi:hypothetical protein